MRRQKRDLSKLAGQKINAWTVLEKVVVSNAPLQRFSYYRCRCDCGCEKTIRATHLIDGKIKTCKTPGCRSFRKLTYSRRSYGDLTQSVWTHIVRSAACRRYEVTVTHEEAWKIFEKQQGRCALTGWEIVLAMPGRSTTASLDRIDGTKGYVPGNLWWVHKDVNMMRRDFGMDRFLELCAAVIKHSRSKAKGHLIEHETIDLFSLT